MCSYFPTVNYFEAITQQNLLIDLDIPQIVHQKSNSQFEIPSFECNLAWKLANSNQVQASQGFPASHILGFFRSHTQLQAAGPQLPAQVQLHSHLFL